MRKLTSILLAMAVTACVVSPSQMTTNYQSSIHLPNTLYIYNGSTVGRQAVHNYLGAVAINAVHSGLFSNVVVVSEASGCPRLTTNDNTIYYRDVTCVHSYAVTPPFNYVSQDINGLHETIDRLLRKIEKIETANLTHSPT